MVSLIVKLRNLISWIALEYLEYKWIIKYIISIWRRRKKYWIIIKLIIKWNNGLSLK